ncbi:MAG: SUMF1/EgtB/PvdO family nonheme iron enzyme [Planctomycetes bacterium]|nr:SUMF1/EgtB/PvdO family nonheme iron enzyme [Planctomycetota bacterium]
MTTKLAGILLGFLLVSGPAAAPAQATAAAGFLLPAPGAAGPEALAARALAARLAGGARTLAPLEGGGFAEETGERADLDGLRVLWLHQGDSAEDLGPAQEPCNLESLRAFVRAGGGLFLSGAALALVEPLGVEPVRPRRGGPGADRGQAALVPVVADHPAFEGLSREGRLVPVSDAGYPAFADFHGTGGPAGGMLLARAPGGSESPLVEYSLGEGRIVAMGWRLPHYAHAANAHRANLERLTANVLGYLADRRSWREVKVPPAPVLAASGAPAPVGPEEWRSLELAVRDLLETSGERYPGGAAYLERLGALRSAHDAVLSGERTAGGPTLARLRDDFEALRREALLANPLLDFEELLVVRRGAGNLGLPMNWEGNSSLPRTGFENEIAVVSPRRPEAAPRTVFRPGGGRFVGDLDLHFDGDRMLFSMPGPSGRWGVFEVRADGSGLRELELVREPDVDNYDACYLPDGAVIFCSTATFTGVPCVRGSSHVANLYRLEPSGAIRRLTVEQDHDWCPAVLPDGRVLYLRWEYTDIPHAFSRILFSMNPDGTGQGEHYGSNSYWPNSLFYARPVPGHPSKLVAVVGGHHDNPRMGELVVLDPALGRREASGAVQRVPGRGRRVEPVLLDGLTAESWPKFLHPWPLSEKHFLVAAKPDPQALWGIYLADVFDNLVLLREERGQALLEPVPLRPLPRPPVIPPRVDLARSDATVYLADVYAGEAMRGVPRGTVKALRLVSYAFAYHGMGGQYDRVGLDGPWDVRRILGTVPVRDDGSAKFLVPALTPIAVQPLDASGGAVQLMRSWFTAMPGEVLSCSGCHERRNDAPAPEATLASREPPSAIAPWRGPPRGFSFEREVQPVLDRLCAGCHDAGAPPERRAAPDLTRREPVHLRAASPDYNAGSRFPPAYTELRKHVRGHTIESDIRGLPPWEFHAETTRLVQMLGKGHAGVRLDAEALDRIVTWIDLNTPAHGTWTEVCGGARVRRLAERRREMRRRYDGVDEDLEAAPSAEAPPASGPAAQAALAAAPAPAATPPGAPGPAEEPPGAQGWPFGAEEARRRQESSGEGPSSVSIELGEGVSLELVRIPAGESVVGDPAGEPDERPAARVRIERPFWMGRFEVTNEQYALFDPSHSSGIEHGDFLQFDERERGYRLDGPRQPVVRVSWLDAMAFCEHLSARTGLKVTLPTEAQWEHACRAGTPTPFWYGGLDDDFSSFANVSDATHHSVDTFGWGLPSGAIPPWRPADARFDDRSRVSAPVGSYKPNAWGLHDMHGNVAEWTRTAYEPYPYDGAGGRDAAHPGAPGRSGSPDLPGLRVARGGSWYDVPWRCRSAFRQVYPAYRPVYDVGFRVVCEGDLGARTPAR